MTLREKLTTFRGRLERCYFEVLEVKEEEALLLLIDVALAAERPKGDQRNLPEYLTEIMAALSRLDKALE